MVLGKHGEDVNVEGKGAGGSITAVHTGLQVRPGDQDQAEQIPLNAELFNPCARTTQKKRVSKYSKP